MTSPASICVHDDLTPSESCVTLMTQIRQMSPAFGQRSGVLFDWLHLYHLWAPQKELSAWQEMVDGLFIQILGRDDHLHHFLHQVVPDVLQADVWDMLDRQDHGVDTQRLQGSLVVLVLHSDLQENTGLYPTYSVTMERRENRIRMVHIHVYH